MSDLPTILWRKSYLICSQYNLDELHRVQVPEKREQLKGDVGWFGWGGEPEVLERQDRQSSWEGLGPEVGLIEKFDISFERNKNPLWGKTRLPSFCSPFTKTLLDRLSGQAQ